MEKEVDFMMEKRQIMLILVAWLSIAACAFLNGALREFVLVPLLPGFLAQALSSALLIMIIFLIAFFTIKKSGLTQREAWTTGITWLILTIIFEFVLGFVMGQSLTEMLQNYNLLQGRLWPLVLLAALLAPVLVKKTEVKK